MAGLALRLGIVLVFFGGGLGSMPHIPHPRKSAKYGRFWADSKFSRSLVAWIKHLLQKKKFSC